MTIISIQKLEEFCENNGYLIKCIYTLQDDVAYIEYVQIISGDFILIDIIHSDYTVEIDSPEYNSYIVLIENLTDTIVSETHVIEDMVNLSDEHYMDHYKPTNITLTDSDILKKNQLRQLHRINQCIKKKDYTMSIFDKTNLYMLNENEKHIIYSIKIPLDTKRMILTTSITLFYTKIQHINEDIQYLKESIYKHLYTIQEKHIQDFDKLFKKSLSPIFVQELYNKTMYTDDTLKNFLVQFIQLCQQITTNEKQLLSQNDTDMDIKLNQLYNIKDKTIQKIIYSRSLRDHLILSVDEFVYENLILLKLIEQNNECINNILNSI